MFGVLINAIIWLILHWHVALISTLHLHLPILVETVQEAATNTQYYTTNNYSYNGNYSNIWFPKGFFFLIVWTNPIFKCKTAVGLVCFLQIWECNNQDPTSLQRYRILLHYLSLFITFNNTLRGTLPVLTTIDEHIDLLLLRYLKVQSHLIGVSTNLVNIFLSVISYQYLIIAEILFLIWASVLHRLRNIEYFLSADYLILGCGKDSHIVVHATGQGIEATGCPICIRTKSKHLKIQIICT